MDPAQFFLQCIRGLFLRPSQGINLSVLISLVALAISITQTASNLGLYIHKSRRESDDEVRRLKIGFFKTLLLDPHLPILNEFFLNIDVAVKKVSGKRVGVVRRSKLNDSIISSSEVVRKHFVDLLPAFKPELHKEVKARLEEFVDDVTNFLLGSDKTFDCITLRAEVFAKSTDCRVQILKLLNEYDA